MSSPVLEKNGFRNGSFAKPQARLVLMAVVSMLSARTGRKLDASGLTTFTTFYVEAVTRGFGETVAFEAASPP